LEEFLLIPNSQLDYDKYFINDFLSNLSVDDKIDLLDYHDYRNLIRSNQRVSVKQIHAISKLAVERRGLTWAKTILGFESQKKKIAKKITDEQIKHTNKRYLWRNFTNDYIESLKSELNLLRKRFKNTYDGFNKEYESRYPSKRTRYYNEGFDSQTSDILKSRP
jgi:hypothetical protein